MKPVPTLTIYVLRLIPSQLVGKYRAVQGMRDTRFPQNLRNTFSVHSVTFQDHMT